MPTPSSSGNAKLHLADLDLLNALADRLALSAADAFALYCVPAVRAALDAAPAPETDPDAVTIAEAAAALGLSAYTVHQMARVRDIVPTGVRCRRIGKSPALYSLAAVRAAWETRQQRARKNRTEFRDRAFLRTGAS